MNGKICNLFHLHSRIIYWNKRKRIRWILIQRFDPIWWILIKLIFFDVYSSLMFTFTSRVGKIYMCLEIFLHIGFTFKFSSFKHSKNNTERLINYNSYLTFYSAQSSSSQSWNLSEKSWKFTPHLKFPSCSFPHVNMFWEWGSR